MRYSIDIEERIIKELEKVPNIRYICNKVGIDHSTFYRWLLRHPTFNKEVMVALRRCRGLDNIIYVACNVKSHDESSKCKSDNQITYKIYITQVFGVQE